MNERDTCHPLSGDGHLFQHHAAWVKLLDMERGRTRIGTNPKINSLASAAAPYLTRGVELNDLLAALVDTIVKNLDADRGTLYLVEGKARRVTSIIAHLPELEQIRLNLGEGIAGWVAQQDQPVRTDDPGLDERFNDTVDKKTGYKTTSMLTVPIRDTGGRVIGVLQLLNKKSGPFTADDETPALELAAQAGRVLECTSLYAELKQSPIGGADDEASAGPLTYRFNQIVGESDAMQRVYGLVEKAARTDASVLLTGESGTGKELIARAVHINSPRKRERFVKVDCTTLPEALIENELFGHEKGAFTGADRTVPGKFEVAHKGTLFIDEIGELPLKLQGKLLRVLQDREFERVGGTTTIQTNIRVICATHRNLMDMVAQGSFREDLYYRIRVVPVALPPLRDRGRKDLMRLVEHFLDKFSRRHGRPISRITDEALAALSGYPFPGNIRELENCIESAVVLCDDAVIDESDLPLPHVRRRPTASAAGGDGLGDPDLSLADVERLHIQRVLDAVGGNQSEAARRLGIGRNTLARKLTD